MAGHTACRPGVDYLKGNGETGSRPGTALGRTQWIALSCEMSRPPSRPPPFCGPASGRVWLQLSLRRRLFRIRERG